MDSFEREWQRWFPEDKKDSPRPAASRGWTIGRVFVILACILVLFIVLNAVKGFYTEWLWFSSLDYGKVYTTILGTKIQLFFYAAIVFFLLLTVNVVLAIRQAPQDRRRYLPWKIVIPVIVIISLIFGLIAQSQWQVVLRFLNSIPFNVADPVFHRDVGFYVFALPFMNLVRGWLLGAVIVTLVICGAVYLFNFATQLLKFELDRPMLMHIGGLFIVVLILVAWGYWLGIWELVFSTRGAVFGATYADIHAKLPAQWIMLAVVIITIGVFIISLMKRNFRWLIYAVAGWVVLAIIVGAIFPAMVQRFQVQPNELALEMPYIEHNIEFTREAFGLNRVDEQPFPAEDAPSEQDLAQNEVTINNIRLWDHRPLKDTYNQIQSIRLYYDFNDVDVDRYVIDDDYRQVMLSARELSAEKLTGQAQTWVNRRLQFTHGYGLALSPVNEVSEEGLPTLLIKDIPPVGDFDIERPQIYYGEKTNEYVIVKTNTQEFDFPMGDENVYGYYEGSGGVNIGSFMRRLIYAWQFGDFNILISGELNTESRAMYYRNIKDRVNHLAPFLMLDDDPYLVVMDGRLFWIQDAYTTTNRYPYSEPVGSGLNYIRNSVKAVIDTYDGSVVFYVMDPDDALIQTYQNIFPDLFVSAEQMPESLRAHLRYPEGMFNIQATVYQTYHMRDARVFYNKEDLWAVPKEVYAGKEQAMESYYIIMRLPDEDMEEFLLMLPFTPVNKNNTIGWLAARCDGDNYGKLLAYFFPKEGLVYGPSQIENRIQQDTIITEQLALWGRGGSRVIRGNLLLIPLGKSQLYVEPVFLQAEAGGLPELKRVIVAIGEQIAMKPTLAESITAIFHPEEQAVEPETVEPTPAEPEGPPAPPEPAEPEIKPPAPAEPQVPTETDIASLIEQAQQHYDNAQQYLQEGDWAGYGEELDALKEVLDQLAELTGRE